MKPMWTKVGVPLAALALFAVVLSFDDFWFSGSTPSERLLRAAVCAAIAIGLYVASHRFAKVLEASLSSETASRTRAEDQLRRSEELYRKLFDEHPHAMWILDNVTNRFLAVNEQAVETYGYSRDEFCSLTLKDIEPSPIQPTSDHVITQRAVSTGTLRVHIHKDGSRRNVEIAEAAIQYYSTTARLVTVTDVTEARAAIDALWTQEHHFRTLAENSPDIIARLDLDGRHTYINSAVSLVTGEPVASIVGTRPRDRHAVNELVEIFDAAIDHIKRTGTRYVDTYSFTGVNGLRRYEGSFTPEFGRDGQIESILHVGRDITDQYNAQATLKSRERDYRTLAETRWILSPVLTWMGGISISTSR